VQTTLDRDGKVKNPCALPGVVTKEVNRKLNDLIAKWVVKGSVSLRVVDGDEFKDIFTFLNPELSVSSRRTLGRNIKNAFGNAQNAIIKLLHDLDSSVALTVDGWSSSTMDSYLGVTVHWIDINWCRRQMVLDVVTAPESHTAASLASAIKEVVDSYGLSGKVISITTDNADNMINAGKLLSAALTSDDFVHIRCGAHTVNLVAQAAYNVFQSRISGLKSVVRYMNKSTKASTDYRRIAETDDEWKARQNRYKPSAPKSRRKIPLDVKTRWDSTYQMLNAALRVGFRMSC
jgi:hypothetical protein